MYMPYDQLPDPSDKFELGEEIGSGCCAKVFKARDLQNDRIVAIKIQPYDKEHQEHIEEEYRILRDHSSYPNLPDFYGTFRQRKNHGCDEIWFVLQYCEGGTAVDLVNRLLKMDRRMKEEHIAFILKEVAKAAVELHRNHFIHRDLRGSNILITSEGEIKLCDFGLTREVNSTFGKRGTCIGSPCWMSPEMVTAQDTRDSEVYDSRSDVWALAITAIELADGKPPFYEMHPTRAMFQIVRNPPPTLFKTSLWSQNLNDFIVECLEKNPENRPHMLEIVEHPFLTENIENEYALQQEIKHLLELCKESSYDKLEEISVDRGFIKKLDTYPEKMFSEDLAAIENPVDEIVMDTLSNRMKMGQSYTFIGDILLSLNSNDLETEYYPSFHEKYRFKSRSENAPHIFSVSDLAYQDMMHHKTPQHVIFSGESYSGKSTNAQLFIKHLSYLGGGNKGATDRVENSIKAILMLTNAGTPLNNNSTRCSIQYHITFGTTGKMSGCVFLINMLEKMRVSTTDMNQHNFHIFYIFYDYIIKNGKSDEYLLDNDRNYRYLRIPNEQQQTKLKYIRDDPIGNVDKYQQFENILIDLDISRKNLETIRKMLSAILNLGNLRFKQNDNKFAELDDVNIATKISDLLRLDEKKFQWSLTQYIKVKGGIAERKQYTTDEARDARDALAATLYNRLVDWIINKINMNLAFPRAVFGDCNVIVVYDMFGFECFHRNGIEQLIINTMNEQMQYHYNQKIFASEMYEQETDGVPTIALNFYDNKQTLDHLLTKPDGLFYKLDDATKENQTFEAILENVADKRSNFVKKHSNTEISIAHYTGKMIYDVRAFIDTNRGFVPPEMIESLRTSLDESIVLMFTNQLSKTGNLTMAFENIEHKGSEDKRKTYNLNTLSQGQYSQATSLRTLSSLFRSTCLEMLKTLSSRSDVGTHFIRCIRSELEYKARNFQPDMVQQQLKALGVMDTILARQKGYSCRISFMEFLRRYQFLAFDFDETVDVTKDNCRLLMIRLKMEGWAIGKSKVFLRYYNDEFLSRLYETQVKKIIKVQSMMRSYISRRRLAERGNPVLAAARRPPMIRQGSQSQAAITIQKAYRGFKVRQKYAPLLCEKTGKIDEATAKFLRTYSKRWRSKSIFQILLHYRAARYQDLVNLSQQVHLYNQRVVASLHQFTKGIQLERIDPRQSNVNSFGPLPLPVRKIPFRLNEIPYFDTAYMCDPVNPLARSAAAMIITDDDEQWDSPLQRNPSLTSHLMTYSAYKKEISCQTNWDRMHESDIVYNQTFTRDSNVMKRNSSISNSTGNHGRQTPNYYHEFGNGTSPFGNSSNYNINFSSNKNYINNSSNYCGNNLLSAGSRNGSRRNSIKKHSAPLPPPMKFNNYNNHNNNNNNNNTWMNKNSATTSTSTIGRKDFRPSNPVRELEMMGRKNSTDNSGGDDPPFNFKSMLRKTNYSRPEDNNYEYNSRNNDDNKNSNKFIAPKLKSIGPKRYDDSNSNSNSNSNINNNRNTNSSYSNDYKNSNKYSSNNSNSNSNSNNDSNSNSNSNNNNINNNDGSDGATYSNSNDKNAYKKVYVDEEIAPGVTLSGYAFNI